VSITAETFAWQAFAACRDEDRALFFGPDGEAGHAQEAREAEAKAVCAGCISRADCLADAITSGIKHGVFGGTGEDERREMRHNYVRRMRATEARAA
jgi:WhiB family redox-sensing transcriptional regulator